MSQNPDDDSASVLLERIQGERDKLVMDVIIHWGTVESNLIKTVSTDAIDAPNATVIDGGGRTLMPGLIENQITHFKIPRHVRFVEQYPMTVTGKIQKFIMREKMAEELDHSGDAV